MDGRYTVSSYNKQGLLTETKEYNKNGEMEGYTVNKYDDKGRMTESQHQNMLFVNSPNQILSQKELYEYDKYGYLTHRLPTYLRQQPEDVRLPDLPVRRVRKPDRR